VTEGTPFPGSVANRNSSSQGGDRAVTMGSIDRHIFRTTLASLAPVLVSLTKVIWMTRALYGIGSLAIEPPAALMDAINGSGLLRLFGRSATA
jgi:hypothetical protein